MSNIFEGKLVRLRAVEPSDWEAHFRWDKDTDDARLTYWIPFPSSTVNTQTWTQNQSTGSPSNDLFNFQIETLNAERVGGINSHTCDLRCGTFRYGLFVAPEHRRKGYASEAIRLVLRYFFQERRYQKCNAGVYSFNEPSQKLHEALGFTLEGRLRRMVYTNGAFHDELIYGITREEFEARNALE